MQQCLSIMVRQLYGSQPSVANAKHPPTTGIVVKEQDGCTQYGGKHPVVQDLGGIDADQIEQCTSEQVQNNTGSNQHCISDYSVTPGQRAGQ